MKILAYTEPGNGCHWIRVRTPLKEFVKHGHSVVQADGIKKIPFEGWDIVIFNNLVGQIDRMNGNQKVGEYDIVEVIKEFQKAGAKVVYDTDDGQDAIPPHIVNKFEFNKVLPSFYKFVKYADLITVTTPELKAHVRKHTKKPIVVLPNSIDPSEFPAKGKEDKIKIGYSGSISHTYDIEIAYPAIKALKKKYSVYFEILGFQHDFCKYKKPVKVYKYYEALASLNADIMICPLEDTEFNRCKSPLKFLESSMTGAAVLASNVYPYKREMKKDWLVNDDEWYARLEELILNKEKREQMAKEQREWILKNRDIRNNWKLWEKKYESILAATPGN